MLATTWIGIVVCAGLTGCAASGSSTESVTPMAITESLAGDERECRVAEKPPRVVRVVQDIERARTSPQFASWPRDAVVVEEHRPDGSWWTIRWFDARENMTRWFPVDIDSDGTDELALFRSTGRGNAGTQFVTILRSHDGVWYEALEVRSDRPVSIASVPSQEHPPYGYVDREVTFGKDARGRTVVVVRTTASVPEGTTLLDATTIAEVARGLGIYRFDSNSGGFVLVGD